MEDEEGRVLAAVDTYARTYTYIHTRTHTHTHTYIQWEFTMEDEQGRVLAAVDKNFAGLGTIVQTLFTDAHTVSCLA
jgi:hypothetical protein